MMHTERMKRVMKPWGWYEIVEKKRTWWIKKLFVKSGAMLSLQSHRFRSEIWTVLTGEIIAQIGRKKKKCRAGETVTIGKNAKHRIKGVSDALVLETAIGRPIERDITRYEDIYRRIR